MATKEALGMSLEISQEYIDSLTRDLLEQSLIETLDAKNTIVESIVSSVLSVKVNDEGRVSGYERENRYTFLEYLVRKMIKDEVKSVTDEVLEEKRGDIREAIRREVNKKANMNKLVDAFFEGLSDNLHDKYRTTIDIGFNFEKDKEDRW